MDDLLHYVKKSKITESLVYGVEVTAICGERLVVACGGGGAGETRPICERCSDIHSRLAPSAEARVPAVTQ